MKNLCRLRNIHNLKNCPFKGCFQCVCYECENELKNGICKKCRIGNGFFELNNKFENLSIKNNQGITKKKTEKNEIVCKELGKNLYFNNLCEKHKIYYKSRLDGEYIDKKNMMNIELGERQKIENFSKCCVCRNELWNTREYRKRKIYQEIQEI